LGVCDERTHDKVQRLLDYRLPYVVLISKLLEHFGVDLEDELSKSMKPNNEVNHIMLDKIGLVKANNGTWMCKLDGGSIRGVGPSETVGEGSVAIEDETMVVEYAMVSYNHPINHGEPFSRFEQMVLGSLDNVFGDQRMHHEFVQQDFSSSIMRLRLFKSRLVHYR